MRLTLVSTVFNEAKRLDQTIEDLKNQSVQPDEIIITDAGSNDGTLEILESWKRSSQIPIVILVKPRCNVAEGRNLAIKAASNDLIVSTDFGCRFDKDWIKTLVAPFNNPEVKVAGGAFGIVEEDIVSTAAKAAYILSGGYRVDVTVPGFIPSSRSIAYRKEVYTKVGGYCEWLTLAADDLVFGKQVLAEGYTFYPVQHRGVFWGRHEQAKGYIKEAFRYGLGDGEARVNQRSFLSNTIEMSLRYLLFAFLIACLLLTVSGIAPAWIWSFNLLLLPGLRSYYGYTKTWLSFRNNKYDFKTFLYGFYLLERTRQSYINGYCKGLFKSSAYQREQAMILKQRLAGASGRLTVAS